MTPRSNALVIDAIALTHTPDTNSIARRTVDVRRLDEARSLLLHTNLPIKRIAYSLGFSSPFHFANRFRLRCGQTPTGFRRHPGTLDAMNRNSAAIPSL